MLCRQIVCIRNHGRNAHFSWCVYLQDVWHAVQFIEKPKAMKLPSIEMAPITHPSRKVMEATGGMSLGLKGEIRSWTYNSGAICMGAVFKGHGVQ